MGSEFLFNPVDEKELAINGLKKLSEDKTKYYEAGFAIHELACKAQEIYQSPKATEEDRRLLLSYIFSNLNLNNGKIRPNYTLAFEFLQEWIPRLNNTFELTKTTVNTKQNRVFDPACSTLLRELDSNQQPTGYTYS